MTENDMTETSTEDDVCSHPECANSPANSVDAVTRERYCSSDHMLKDNNNRKLNGEKFEPDVRAPEEDVVITIEELYCPMCTSDENTVSAEDREWVHNPCGMPVPNKVAEKANKKIMNGEGEFNYTEKRAKEMFNDIKGANGEL